MTSTADANQPPSTTTPLPTDPTGPPGLQNGAAAALPPGLPGGVSNVPDEHTKQEMGAWARHSDGALNTDRRVRSFSQLVVLVDVMYGAILGYIIIRLAERTRVLFQNGFTGIESILATSLTTPPPVSSDVLWQVLAIEAFVLNILFARMIESRISATRVPYRSRARVLCDILAGFVFLIGFMAGEEMSIFLLAVLAAVFTLLAISSYYLVRDAPTAESLKWSRTLLGIHLATAVTFGGAFVQFYVVSGVVAFTASGVAWLWFWYVVWLVPVLILKALGGVGYEETDLGPSTLLEMMLRPLVDGLVTAFWGLNGPNRPETNG